MLAQYILEFILCAFAGLTMARHIVPPRTHHTAKGFWCDRVRSVAGVLFGLLLIETILILLPLPLMPLRLGVFTLLGALGEVTIRYIDYSLQDN